MSRRYQAVEAFYMYLESVKKQLSLGPSPMFTLKSRTDAPTLWSTPLNLLCVKVGLGPRLETALGEMLRPDPLESAILN